MLTYAIPANQAADIDALAEAVRAFTDGALTKNELKPIHVRLGVYEQRLEGTYMLRVRNTGGMITPAQLGAVAGIASVRGASLHITTRQELQLHGLTLTDLVPVMRELATVALSSFAGGGNTVRNIVAPPDAGVRSGEIFDVEPHHRYLTERLIADAASTGLPRKFKIAFAAGDDDPVLAAVHDVGFHARLLDGRRGFRVTVAGGQGARPAAGRPLLDFIDEHQILPVVIAIRAVFSRLGDRTNRARARLRFLWESMGAEAFRREFEAELAAVNIPDEARAVRPIENGCSAVLPEETPDDPELFALWRSRYTASQKQPGAVTVLVPVVMGELSVAQASALAGIAAQWGKNTIRFTTDQNILLRNIPECNLGNLYNALAPVFAVDAPPFAGRMVACTGAATCTLGLCRSRDAAMEIIRAVAAAHGTVEALSAIRIRVSGCPNACAQHWTADLGFSGVLRRHGGHAYAAYQVYVASGADGALAESVGIVPAEHIGEFTAALIEEFLAKAAGYAFREFCAGDGGSIARRLAEGFAAVISVYADDPAIDS